MSKTSRLQSKSKFLSLILRHKPEQIGLALDAGGWAEIDGLVALANERGAGFTHELIADIVESCDKKRYAISPDGKRIRANQGHSFPVDLNLVAQEPPPLLFHGTATTRIPSIREKGLIPGSRQHVHLSLSEETALKVGSRHGEPVLLTVDAASMYRDGYEFFLSENGVWLTDSVPTSYLGESSAMLEAGNTAD